MPAAPAAQAQPGGDDFLNRIYQAQCIKDETMAESIAAQFAGNERPLVVHFNGVFHSDFKLGAAMRVQRRLPQAKIKVVSALPVENLDALKPDAERKRGDYLLYTLKPLGKHPDKSNDQPSDKPADKK